MPNALIIGNSAGIGLAVTIRLLDAGWAVRGISRSPSPIEHPCLAHVVSDVRAPQYSHEVREAIAAVGELDALIYCAGIGEELDTDQLAVDVAVFQVNLMGLVATVEAALPSMLAAGRGHLIGLSSQADRFLNPGAPSYSASKAGMSSYLEGLALAVRGRGVHITNLRFGFVDTKMARSEVTPFLISADRAAAIVMRCLKKRPIRYTYPRRMAALLWLVSWGNRARIWLS